MDGAKPQPSTSKKAVFEMKETKEKINKEKENNYGQL
tara:strand:- start:240 stop:350 length:111 start_codon:yes stop_codon:yes gene_type:complete